VRRGSVDQDPPEAFQQKGIAVGAVVSSPRCRCLDTARLAFGRVEAWEALQGALSDAARRQRQLAEIRQRIAEHQAGSTSSESSRLGVSV
jgi:broad specificity phosphatase PhoE